MYYKILEIYIGRRFLKGGCYSQQVISDVAIRSPDSLTPRVPET